MKLYIYKDRVTTTPYVVLMLIECVVIHTQLQVFVRCNGN
jgi:hypothetical protein